MGGRHQLLEHYHKFRTFSPNFEVVGGPFLERDEGFVNENGEVPFEVDWVILAKIFFAAADFYDSGERFNEPVLKEFAIELEEAVARQVWLVPENGLGVAAPWAWYPRKYVYPGYSQALAVCELLHAIKPLDQLSYGPLPMPGIAAFRRACC